MIFHSKMFIISCSGDDDFSYDKSKIIINEDRCVIYSSSSLSQDCDEEKIFLSLKFDEEMKERYQRILPYLYKMRVDEELNYGMFFGGYNLADIQMIDDDEDNERFMACYGNLSDAKDVFSEINDMDSAKHISSKDVFALIAYVLPKRIAPRFLFIFEEDAKTLDEYVEEVIAKCEKKRDLPLKTTELASYPQSQVKDENIIKALNDKYSDISKWVGFGYKANDFEGEYNLYIDVEFGGERYRGVYLKAYRPVDFGSNVARSFDNAQENNGFELNTPYWFKYEPIEWYSYERDGKKILLSKKVLDAGSMHFERSPIFDYESSFMFGWMRQHFGETAHLNDEIHGFKDIRIPTKDEFLSYLPSKKDRKPNHTDYALVKGFMKADSIDYNDKFVYSSTYMHNMNRMASLSYDGSMIDFHFYNIGFITYTIGGIQPLIEIVEDPE